MFDENDFQKIPYEERRLMATWAIKTARTEEWTGQQVMRLLPTLGEAQAAALLQHAKDEFRHAQLYAGFAYWLADGATPEPSWGLDRGHRWLDGYVADRGNFRDAGFTSIFRAMDGIQVCHAAVPGRHASGQDDLSIVRFYTALFFLDLAGLMTVNVYDESPFTALQEIALEIREDESRHVQFGRDFLMTADPDQRRAAVAEMLPHINKFFGSTVSPLQKTLEKYGIRSTPNTILWERFGDKIAALLRV